jgi:hypothetical protein
MLLVRGAAQKIKFSVLFLGWWGFSLGREAA